MQIEEELLKRKITLELMKKTGLISDYEIVGDTKNYSVAEDGAICFDVFFSAQIVPKAFTKEVTINLGVDNSD